MNKIELLSPAGNLNKLKIAIRYGADAVYASVGNFSLRQRSGKEFNLETFKEGIEFAHSHGKKFYATVNAFPFNLQIDGLRKHLRTLGELGVDAFIVATPGVMSLIKEEVKNPEIHLSTQANIMNYLDAEIYHKMGASRIVVAREISLKDVIEIKKRVLGLEIEIFCHGSMCFAYSGRCLVSAVQSGRFSNRGSCANDCRFSYELFAKSKENGALFKLEEENKGTYIMNSKDLNLANHIEKIIKSGVVNSFKIEGRTKSEYYVACTTKVYRMAIDDALSGNFNPELYQKELNSLSNRGFMDGYVIHKPYERDNSQNHNSSIEEGTHQVLAISYDGETFQTKGKIIKGQDYEIFVPNNEVIQICDNEIGTIALKDNTYFVNFKKLLTETNKELEKVHSGNLNKMKLPIKLPEFSFLRKEI